jgi:hypothetical protein
MMSLIGWSCRYLHHLRFPLVKGLFGFRVGALEEAVVRVTVKFGRYVHCRSKVVLRDSGAELLALVQTMTIRDDLFVFQARRRSLRHLPIKLIALESFGRLCRAGRLPLAKP